MMSLPLPVEVGRSLIQCHDDLGEGEKLMPFDETLAGRIRDTLARK